MQEDFERFGIPSENIEAAQKWAKKQRKKYEYHTHVPTRKEVLNLSITQLTPLLVGWMVHSPIEIVPSRIQVEQVIELLQQRDDRDASRKLLDMCRHYVNGH
ncbi:hypothetical protein GTP56_16990 [Duganella sp. FT134W]|uniref:Uncharacterized protein n=1 Tax=Duganella margarita TaxID=2692170 RepID=A0A7X4H221_9BURK|nr:hypothetical protein [Duganella margarita]MYM73887.1 hypothetical protein [Duganella margarita]